MATSQPLDESNALIPIQWISKKGSGDESFKRGESWRAKDVSCGGRFSIDALPIFDCVSKLVNEDSKSGLVPNVDGSKVKQLPCKFNYEYFMIFYLPDADELIYN